MSMIEKLKADRMQAMKDKNDLKKNLLGTLIGDCCKDDKNPGDAAVIAMIKKFLKNANETFKASVGKRDVVNISHEMVILEDYLPEQLGEQAVKTVIANMICTTEITMKDVMAFFKKNFEGQYDGAMVSRIAKEVCNG